MNRKQNSMLQEAIRYHKLGYNVIPLRKSGKKPLIPWKEYQQRRSTIDEIRGWWERWPDANIGIVSGRSTGTIVLDIDGPIGEKFIKDSGGLPDTPKCRTAKGHHYYLKYPSEFDVRCTENKDLQIGIKGNGGYVVAPPSIHPSGQKYFWIKGFPPWKIEPAPLNKCKWLARYLADYRIKKEEEKEVPTDSVLWADKLLLNGVSEGERNMAITKLAGRYVGKGLSKIEIMPILLEANNQFDPPLDQKEVGKTLDSVINSDNRKSDGTDKIYTSSRGEGRGLLQLLAEPLEQPDYLIKPFLQTGDKGFLVSSYKVGKTLFSMQMTLSLSHGIPFLGFETPQPRKVLFIRFELSWRRFKKSLQMMKMGLNPPGPCQVDPVFELVTGFNILGQENFEWLNRMIDKHEPALLILDPFYKLTDCDLRDTSSAMPLIRRFESIRGRYNDLCILINAHQVKNARNEKDWDTSYGPMQFFADMDFELRLRVNNRDSKNAIFTLDHISNDEGIEPMKLRRDPNTLLYYPDHSVKEKKQSRDTDEFEKARQSLTAFIDKNGRKPNQTEFRQMIKTDLKASDNDAKDLIKAGEGNFWKKFPEGKGKPTLYEPIPDNSVQTLESQPC